MMNSQNNKQFFWPLIVSLCLVLPLALASCGGGSSSSNETLANDPTDGSGGQVETGNMLALVVDPQEAPVTGAMVGPTVTTASSGVAAGSLTPSDSGWVVISAPGYAPNYIRKEGTLEGRDIYETTLTPLSVSALHDGSSTTTLTDDPGEFSLALSLPPTLFEENEVAVEFARIERANLGPVFAGNDFDDTLGILMAFSVEARNPAGGEAAFSTGQTAQVTIVDNGEAGDSPLLASFDPAVGTWEVYPEACSRLNETTIQCQMQHFSVNGVLGAARKVVANGAHAQAKADLEQALADWAADGGGEPVPDSVQQALEHLADVVIDYANQNPTEVAKQRLFSVMAKAQLIGRMDISDTVSQKAGDVTEQIAQALLADPDCGKLKELLAAAAQCQVLGLDELSEDLLQKAKDLLTVCNVWAETVNYVFLLEEAYPLLEGYTHYSGPQNWREEHSLLLAIDPESFNVAGEDTVSISMAEVTYRTEADPSECGDGYTQRKNWTSGNRIDLSMDGKYSRVNDRPNFTFSALRKDSSDVTFSFSDLFHFWDTDPCSLTEFETNGNSLPSYSSLLLHGFNGTIPLSLEAMLNEGSYSTYGNFELIKGSRVVDIPIDAVGLYPLTKAMVGWSFVHERLQAELAP